MAVEPRWQENHEPQKSRIKYQRSNRSLDAEEEEEKRLSLPTSLRLCLCQRHVRVRGGVRLNWYQSVALVFFFLN